MHGIDTVSQNIPVPAKKNKIYKTYIKHLCWSEIPYICMYTMGKSSRRKQCFILKGTCHIYVALITLQFLQQIFAKAFPKFGDNLSHYDVTMVKKNCQCIVDGHVVLRDGHVVLRCSNMSFDLNPIESIWGLIRCQ